MTCFFLPVAISMISAIQKLANNPYLRFANGMDEETAMIIVAISIIGAFVGMLMMFVAWIKKRNKNALDSLQNFEKDSFCTHCRVNVSSKDGICPICKRKLKEK